MGLPDAVYVCRPGENPELRTSLRSLAKNAAGTYRKVWIVGTVLPWLRNIEPLPLEPLEDKFENQRQSLTAAVNHPGLADRFVLLNDDHFIVERIEEWQTFHLGPVSPFLAEVLEDAPSGCDQWARAVYETAAWTHTQTGEEPLCYEAHVPLLFDKARLAAVLDAYPPHRRLVVGETYPLTGAGGVGQLGCNSKVDDAARGLLMVMSSGLPYLSTEDSVFASGLVGEWLRGQFPDPCIYEEAAA